MDSANRSAVNPSALPAGTRAVRRSRVARWAHVVPDGANTCRCGALTAHAQDAPDDLPLSRRCAAPIPRRTP